VVVNSGLQVRLLSSPPEVVMKWFALLMLSACAYTLKTEPVTINPIEVHVRLDFGIDHQATTDGGVAQELMQKAVEEYIKSKL
jgi:hypothetical protein